MIVHEISATEFSAIGASKQIAWYIACFYMELAWLWQTRSRLSICHIIYQTRETVFNGISRYRGEESWKYDATLEWTLVSRRFSVRKLVIQVKTFYSRACACHMTFSSEAVSRQTEITLQTPWCQWVTVHCYPWMLADHQVNVVLHNDSSCFPPNVQSLKSRFDLSTKSRKTKLKVFLRDQSLTVK